MFTLPTTMAKDLLEIGEQRREIQYVKSKKMPIGVLKWIESVGLEVHPITNRNVLPHEHNTYVIDGEHYPLLFGATDSEFMFNRKVLEFIAKEGGYQKEKSLSNVMGEQQREISSLEEDLRELRSSTKDKRMSQLKKMPSAINNVLLLGGITIAVNDFDPNGTVVLLWNIYFWINVLLFFVLCVTAFFLYSNIKTEKQ